MKRLVYLPLLAILLSLSLAQKAAARDRTVQPKQCSTWNERLDNARTSFFIPPHVRGRGDREFEGHGPDVRVHAEIYISRDRRQVLANLHMHARETKSDWTTAAGSVIETLYTAPSHSRINAILGDQVSDYRYTDNNHHEDRFSLASGELVNLFVIQGDARGIDAGVNTGVRAYFNPIWLELRRIDNC